MALHDTKRVMCLLTSDCQEWPFGVIQPHLPPPVGANFGSKKRSLHHIPLPSCHLHGQRADSETAPRLQHLLGMHAILTKALLFLEALVCGPTHSKRHFIRDFGSSYSRTGPPCNQAWNPQFANSSYGWCFGQSDSQMQR